MIQINEWLPAFVCVMNFGATIIQKPVKQNSPIVSKWTACENRNLTARNEKNSACDFFSHSWNFDAISCKKMREYREIAPENDPWTWICPVIANGAGPVQLASSESIWSGSAWFGIKYVNFYQQLGSNNLIGWKLEAASQFIQHGKG